MAIEPLPPIQASVLYAIEHEHYTGKEIRAWLAARGHDIDGPKFYQLMRRISDLHLVESVKQVCEIDGKRYRESVYVPTSKGRKLALASARFYCGLFDESD